MSNKIDLTDNEIRGKLMWILVHNLSMDIDDAARALTVGNRTVNGKVQFDIKIEIPADVLA